MKRHLNTLFVTSEGAYLAKQGEAVSVKIDDEIKLRIPLINLEGIVCFGAVGVSPFLLGACVESNVAVSFLSGIGRYLASVVGHTNGNVLLRRAQYRAADDEQQSLRIARNIVVAKIVNARSVLMRGARDSPSPDRAVALRQSAEQLLPAIPRAQAATSLDELRGLEGIAARFYFDGFNALLRPTSGFQMDGRSRRPPLDPVNALLSFLYSLLAHDLRSAAGACGLDAAVGFLHRDRSGRPGLALDLMEEFRPFIADRLAISLINRGQVAVTDFEREPAGGFTLCDKARKAVLVAYQQRKEGELLHPFLRERVSVGLLPHIQARLLARCLRGDLDAYPAFIWK